MAHSLALDRDVELSDDYREVEAGSRAAGRKIAGKRLDRHLRDRGGRLVFAHPLGLSLLAAPLIALLNAVSPSAAPDLLLGIFGLNVTFLGLLAGWELLARELGDPVSGGLIAFALYFRRPLWFYGRTFFTELFIWSFAVLAVWCFGREWWGAGSLLLGFDFLFKETAALILVPVLLFLVARHGLRRAAWVSLLPAVLLLLFLAKNRWLYGEWLVFFYPFEFGNFFDGARGVLFDSRHGLIPFAPLVLLALAGRRRNGALRGGWRRDPATSAWIIVVFYILVTAAWSGWTRGSCYGPRLLLPILPALALPLARAWRAHHAKAAFRLSFLVLWVFGSTVQWCAATDPFRAFWEISLPELLSGRWLSTLSGFLLGTTAFILAQRGGAMGSGLARASFDTRAGGEH